MNSFSVKTNYTSKHLKQSPSLETTATTGCPSTMSSLYESFSVENDLSNSNLMEEKNYNYIWYENDESGFEPVVLLGFDNKTNKNLVELQDGQQIKVALKEKIYVNPKCMIGVDDLLTMNQFDIGPLLHTVRLRYYRSEIYTAVGPPILISVNPYTNLSSLYSEETQEMYQSLKPSFPGLKISYNPSFETNLQKLKSSSDANSNRSSKSLDHDTLKPHIYRIAQNCLKQMYECRYNQSIIISGESGAGKTEATKKILAYLSSTSKKYTANWNGKKQREFADMTNQLAHSNHLLESFGNAKTIRNDNSSRFGKFTQVYFSADSPNLIGASVTSYLLEKSRIVRQQESERVDDVDQFRLLLKCFDELKFLSQNKSDIFKLLGGILHFGNVTICENDASNSVPLDSISNVESFDITCELFGVDQKDLCQLLQFKNIIDAQTDNKIQVPRTEADIEAARDAIVKAIYEKLFHWIIINLNKELAAIFIKAPEKQESGSFRSRFYSNQNGDRSCGSLIPERLSPWVTNFNKDNITTRNSKPEAKYTLKKPNAAEAKQSIGLLDIFGFEVFEINSFEQLCINFANEQLQRQFNLHVFQEEQHLYGLEEIDWTVIPFLDNKDIISALTDRISGVFPMLDSESLVPKSNYKTFLSKIYALAGQSNNDIIIKPQSVLKRSNQFGIRHYAGPVYYSAIGFLEKNCDRVFPDAIDYFKTAKNPLLSEIFSQPDPYEKTSAAHGRPGFIKATVSATFRDQLDELIKALEQTTTSYIRCIKPNSYKASLSFDSVDVLRQLKCAGVLESIRIRKSGYPIRIGIMDFSKRYRTIMKLITPEPQVDASPMQKMRETLISFMNEITTMYIMDVGIRLQDHKEYWQVGKSKIFLKAQIQQYIDSKLLTIYKEAAIKIQSHIRRFLAQKYYKATLKAARTLQEYHQYQTMYTSFILYYRLRNSEAVRIQRCWRNYCVRKRINAAKIILNAWRLYKERLLTIASKLNNETLEDSKSSSVLSDIDEPKIVTTMHHSEVKSKSTEHGKPGTFSEEVLSSSIQRNHKANIESMRDKFSSVPQPPLKIRTLVPPKSSNQNLLNKKGFSIPVPTTDGTTHKKKETASKDAYNAANPADFQRKSSLSSNQFSQARQFSTPFEDGTQAKRKQYLKINNFDRVYDERRPHNREKSHRDTQRLLKQQQPNLIYKQGYPRRVLNRLTETMTTSSDDSSRRPPVYSHEKMCNSQQLYECDVGCDHHDEIEDPRMYTMRQNNHRSSKGGSTLTARPKVPKLRINMNTESQTYRPSYHDPYRPTHRNGGYYNDEMYYENSSNRRKANLYYSSEKEEDLYIQNELLKRKIDHLYDVISDYDRRLESKEATILGLSTALSKALENQSFMGNQDDMGCYARDCVVPHTSRVKKIYTTMITLTMPPLPSVQIPTDPRSILTTCVAGDPTQSPGSKNDKTFLLLQSDMVPQYIIIYSTTITTTTRTALNSHNKLFL